MKSFILLLGLILSLSVFGQTSIYHPFPTSNATWNYKCVETSPTGSLSDALGRYSFLMTGDSTIAGVTYHKISCPAIV